MLPSLLRSFSPSFPSFSPALVLVLRRLVLVLSPLYICHPVHTFSWSPRWTGGSPRMLLLVLIREFESRRGEIL